MIARAAAEAIHNANPQCRSQFDAVHKGLMVLLRDFLVWVERIAMAGDRRDGEPPLLHLFQQPVSFTLVLQELLDLQVSRAWIGSSAELNGLDAFRLNNVERLLEGLISEKGGEDTDLHIGFIMPPTGST